MLFFNFIINENTVAFETLVFVTLLWEYQDYIPSRLEQRREIVKKNDDLETQLAEADLRRKQMEEERIKKMTEISGLNKFEKVLNMNDKVIINVICSGSHRSNKTAGS